MTVTDNRPLNVSEVAARLGISDTTVRNYVVREGLPCFFLPNGHRRFHWSEVERWLNDQQTARDRASA